MSYDEATAQRVRQVLSRTSRFTEVSMFGGLCFLVNDNMCCGISGTALMVRVGAEAHEAALGRPHTRPMIMQGKSLRAFILVDAAGYRTEAAPAGWVQRGMDFASTLPPKQRPAPTARSRKRPR